MAKNIGPSAAPIVAVEGPNFSGRSAYLGNRGMLTSTRHDQPRVDGRFYLGPDVPNYLSGLLPTVLGELLLHGYSSSPRKAPIDVILEVANLLGVANHNPLTLSGGQQVILALSTALLSAGRVVAIDCLLEQLSPIARAAVLGVLTRHDLEVSIVLADNRLSEFRECVTVTALPEWACRSGERPAALEWLPVTPTSAVPSIALDEIGFCYSPRRTVIKNFSYLFTPGTVYFLHGPNGVGKSTLGKLLCGLLKPTKGKFVLGGNTHWEPWKSPGQVVAYHFQNPDVQLFSTRVADQFGAGAHAVTSSFGLEPFLQAHPHDLPFALRKRVAIAMTIARMRPWLLLDEPILGQDDENSRVLAKILSYAAKQGAGVIVFSHSHWFKGLFDNHRALEMGAYGLRELPP